MAPQLIALKAALLQVIEVSKLSSRNSGGKSTLISDLKLTEIDILGWLYLVP